MKSILLCLSFFSLMGCRPSSCYQNVYCNEYEIPALVGYDRADLDSVTLNVYNADSTFSNLVYTVTIYDSALYSASIGNVHPWTGISLGYPNSDTIEFAGFISQFFDLTIQPGNNFIPHDWEVIIWNLNKTFRFSNITFTGDITERMYACDSKGDPKDPGSCGRMISSYVLNGTAINIPKSINNYYLYIAK